MISFLDERLDTTEKFWPDEIDQRLKFGNSFIKKLSEESIPEVPGLVERRLEILADGVVNWHVICQYHFTAWSDRNLQKMTKPMLNFCKIIKMNMDRSNGTCAIHCNDSVGRTGVFIGLMNILNDLDNDKEEIDIFGSVFKMRAERMKMVTILDISDLSSLADLSFYF